MKKNYETINAFYFPKQFNYILYWLFVGFFYFIASEITVRFFHETYFLNLRIATCILFTAVGINANLIRKRLAPVLLSLFEIIEFPEKEFTELAKTIDQSFFTFKSRITKLVFFLLFSFFIILMFIYGFPFRNKAPNILLVISFIPIIGICSLGANAIIGQVVFLYKFVDYPTKVPFNLIKHPAVLKLSEFSSKSSLYVLICYVWYAITMWISPYKLEGVFLLITLGFGFFPLTMFLWSFLQIHVLLKNIKHHHIQIINSQIQISLDKFREKPSAEQMELLKKLMEVQQAIETQSDWTIAFNETITFFITLGIPTLNTFMSLKSIFKP